MSPFWAKVIAGGLLVIATILVIYLIVELWMGPGSGTSTHGCPIFCAGLGDVLGGTNRSLRFPFFDNGPLTRLLFRI